MEYQRLNTVSVPDAGWRKRALAWAREITKERKGIFRIDDRRFLAHLTIYSPEYPARNFEKVCSQVEELAGNLAPFQLPFLNFSAVGGFVGANFAKTELAEKSHREVVARLNPLRGGYIREKYVNESDKYPPQQREFIRKFGSPLVFGYYQPHLTLARFDSDDEAKEVAMKLNWHKDLPPVKIKRLAVAATGPNGTCTKFLRVYALGGKKGRTI